MFGSLEQQDGSFSDGDILDKANHVPLHFNNCIVLKLRTTLLVLQKLYVIDVTLNY